MKPIYATMCTKDNGIWPIGLYEEQQDAFKAMIEDLKESINYTVEEDNYSDLRLSEGTFTPGMELDMMTRESSGFCARIDKDGMGAELVTSSERVIEWTIKQADKDAGKAYLNVRRFEATWEIVQITEVIKHQDNKEDDNNG